MLSDDEIKENLLNPRPSRRVFWWNTALLALVVIVAVVIFNGVMKRRRAREKEILTQETAAMPAIPQTGTEPSRIQKPIQTPNLPRTVTETSRRQTQAPRAPALSTAPAPALSPGAVQNSLNQIRALRDAGQKIKAREQCYEYLDKLKDASAIRAIEDILGEINIELLLTPAAMPEKTDYVVKTGDSLARIAKQFGTTVELVQMSNQVRGHMIRPGDRMRVFNAPFSLRISKSRNELEVYAGGRFFKRYQVGTGKHGTTPAGIFVINDKIPEPPWWRPDGQVVPFGDKDNVLGTRWLSLKPVEGTDPVRGYGIHGTWEPETIGKQASAGCVRLLNEDVEQLYILLPLGARVVIEE